MIKAFILYYLSLKATHGYEIQKFIQLNHMDNWTKIQSGSIYYALNKLEKEQLIRLYKEEAIGSKIRKIYEITPEGRDALSKLLEEELDKEIYEIGSDKFTIYPVLNGMTKPVIEDHVIAHIKQLEAKQAELNKWEEIQVKESSLKVERMYFEMMRSSLKHQIQWHQALLEELDACMAYSQKISNVIKSVDFSTINDMKAFVEQQEQQSIEELKADILSNPEQAEAKLEELIKRMQK